jgi:cytochrome oxidase assembly protein ShyY1
MKQSLAKTMAAFAVIAIVISFALAMWRLERWINWKFDYGSRVENRLEQLEKRIEELEKQQ